jgi:hypothetical protein
VILAAPHCTATNAALNFWAAGYRCRGLQECETTSNDGEDAIASRRPPTVDSGHRKSLSAGITSLEKGINDLHR